jgi:hypothetical protein
MHCRLLLIAAPYFLSLIQRVSRLESAVACGKEASDEARHTDMYGRQQAAPNSHWIV